MTQLRVGLLGEYDASVTAHQAIPRALALAGASEGMEVEPVWVPTDSIDARSPDELAIFDALWCVPASPYASTDGALAAIRFARERRLPFLGTCGGFQHALIEYARNVAGLAHAEHAESSPHAEVLVVAPLACSLVEQEGGILLERGSRVREIYDRARIVESYHCSFGLNPSFEARLDDGAMCFTGRDEAGEVRVLELTTHPFFIATLFQPERSALRDEEHPLIRAFVRAAG